MLHSHAAHCEKAAKCCMVVSHTEKRLSQAFPKAFWPLQCSCKDISQEESEPHSYIELTFVRALGRLKCFCKDMLYEKADLILTSNSC